ncbi:MAG: dual specificity protein phosphatase family protein [Deltaproteobacteria bacterium]|nr:dual specificity protein phosphatase family protein [Deltaproteobacteria bacterium]
MSKLFRLRKSTSGRNAIASAFVALIIALFFAATFSALASENPIIPNFAKVADGVYRGGRPRKAGVYELKRLGIKTIINLDADTAMQETDDARDERQWATEAGIKYIYVPMSPVSTPTTESIDAALRQMLDPANQPVFVHCYRGSDRTGTVIAAYRITDDGWDIERAYEEMKQYGHAYKVLHNWKEALLPFAERAKR